MDVQRKCIYCGTEDDLTESDIIPDALTAARIINRCVCQKKHNSEMTEKFESEVSQRLAFITNYLNIKSTKSKHYADYSADYKINDIEYHVKKVIRENDFVDKIIWDSTKSHALGPVEKISGIAKAKRKSNIEIDEVDLNNVTIEKNVLIDIDVFFSKAMFRQVAKIAYEWYCAKNNVRDKYDIFNEIITFILDGKGNNIVSLVTNESVLSHFKQFCNHGSHALFGYIDKDGGISVMVDMFGVALYNVKVCNTIPDFCKFNCLLQKINVDGTGNRECESLCLKDYNDLATDMLEGAFENPNISSTCIENIPVKVCLSGKKNANFNLFIMDLLSDLSKGIIGTKEATPSLFDFVYKQIEILLQCSVLHKRGIYRFIEEHITGKEIVLNPNGTDKDNIFLYYILYVVGRSKYQTIDDENFNEIYLKTFGTRDYEITDENMKAILNEMLSDSGYNEYIKQGVEKMYTWK